ncbi:MAG: hypothetical protein K2O95_03720 [Clostridia bacterium]|nr:hypothetical protein [Clostridia bacterium]MDE7079206.1 hypothetical protein [Clostridia bacterium]
MEDKRLSFDDRIKSMGEDVQKYHSMLQEYLLSFKKVKSRLSNRCDSYRVARDLLSKMAIGGKTLKIYLAIDSNREDVLEKKLHFRDLSSSLAYREVPAMIPVKSELCVKKVCEVIDIMMKEKGITKKK